MPWHVGSSNTCPASKPLAVIKNADGKVEGCHATRQEANKQMAALYANEPQAGRAQMSAASINDLPDSAFAYIEPGGKKDAEGKTVPRSLRHFPIHDADHVRNALARAPQSPFGDKAMPKIHAAAKKFGIEMGDHPAPSGGRSEQFLLGPQLFIRSFPLEECRILTRAQGSEYADGRTVEAYAAVFDREAEIQDYQGHYKEVIDRAAFNKVLADAKPTDTRSGWAVRVFYNHGMTLQGTPSDLFSVPLGSPVDIRVTDHGLLTVTRYNQTPLAEQILEAIRSGDINGQSFTGRIIRSDPMRPPAGGYRRTRGPRGGVSGLMTVRRMELGLREYGPTPFPAYTDAVMVGVRSLLAGMAWPALSATRFEEAVEDLVEAGITPEEATRMVTDEDEPTAADTPTEAAAEAADAGAVTDEPPTPEGEHSSRSSLLQRIAVAKTTRPGLAQPLGSDVRRARVQAITRPQGGPSEPQGNRGTPGGDPR